MRYTRIALYDIKSGSFADIVDKAKSSLGPLFQASPGFESYGVAEIDKNSFVSVSIWKTREQADAASTKAADWAKTNSREQLVLRTTTSVTSPSTRTHARLPAPPANPRARTVRAIEPRR